MTLLFMSSISVILAQRSRANSTSDELREDCVCVSV